MLSPAEHQVIADRDPAESRPGRGLDDGDQAEVGRPAADVADEDQTPRRGPLAARRPGARRSSNRRPPAAPRAGRQVRIPACFRREDRQLPRRLVERGRHGQDDLLPFEQALGVVEGERHVPGVADVTGGIRPMPRPARPPGIGLGRTPRAGSRPRDRRPDGRASSWRSRPGGRHPRPLNPRELADDPVAPLGPGRVPRAGRQLVRPRQIEERREHRPRAPSRRPRRAAGCRTSGYRRRPLAALGVDIRHRAIGRARGRCR